MQLGPLLTQSQFLLAYNDYITGNAFRCPVDVLVRRSGGSNGYMRDVQKA